MIRILLAEDDTSMREYLQRALIRVGYEVEAVGCGTEAMPLTATPRQIFVNIDEQGRYFVRGQQFTVDSLGRLLSETAANNPASQSVVIRADRRVAWDYVATAMRLCNEAGLRDYSASLAEEN